MEMIHIPGAEQIQEQESDRLLQHIAVRDLPGIGRCQQAEQAAPDLPDRQPQPVPAEDQFLKSQDQDTASQDQPVTAAAEVLVIHGLGQDPEEHVDTEGDQKGQLTQRNSPYHMNLYFPSGSCHVFLQERLYARFL